MGTHASRGLLGAFVVERQPRFSRRRSHRERAESEFPPSDSLQEESRSSGLLYGEHSARYYPIRPMLSDNRRARI